LLQLFIRQVAHYQMRGWITGEGARQLGDAAACILNGLP
jgi:hypothetical protein